MNSRGARLARGWVVGAFATALAALSHSVAGSGTPSSLGIVAGVLFGGMLGTLLTGRRPSLPRLAIAVGGSQLAFHSLFSLLGTTGSVSAGHQHGAALVVSQGTANAHVESSSMWLAHAVAGVLTLAMLQRAERAAWRLLIELARLVAAPFRTAPSAPHPSPPQLAPFTIPHPVSLLTRMMTAALSRRGPPISIAF